MSENFACPNCRMLLQISPDQLGRQVRCPVCGLISVFGSPIEEQRPSETSEDWQPVEETRSPKSTPTTPISRATPSSRGAGIFQTFKGPNRNTEGDWETIHPTPNTTEPERQAPRQSANKYVIDETPAATSSSPLDKRWQLGFTFSLLSLLSAIFPVCFCCVVPPFGTVGLALAGIVTTYRSQEGPKSLNYALAGIGLLLSFFTIFIWIVATLLGV